MKLKKQIIICLLLINGIGLILPKHFTKPFILDVPLICQYPLLPTGCESVGATMLLQYYGIDIDEITFASYWFPSSQESYIFLSFNSTLFKTSHITNTPTFCITDKCLHLFITS